ncbi:nuclear transport factor 2 family protein [Mucilaginibacter lappiensis]|uniref:SnoaL-like domain-containing protein n=1 Tax=Mucilaginibacter lappiensis TaxID=354630 RepID=A0A841JIP8_9SPHI|nr:nuclear transport factor 2 family protein [Mucilaginibacter lappiensis]MBB6130817.1 hypothetical protein [Mucilaginibacter lappiensis]
MKNITDKISRYLSAWNEKTTESVKAAFLECCAPEITFTDREVSTYTDDPDRLIKGIDELTDLVIASVAKIPSYTFSILTTPQYFDGHGLYSWGLQIPGQEVKVGWDYFQYNAENMITSIVGFLPE